MIVDTSAKWGLIRPQIRYTAILLIAVLLSACLSGETEELETQAVTSTGGTAAGLPSEDSVSAPPADEPGLSGHLLYMTFVEADAALVSYDLETDDQEVLFTFPSNGWISHFGVSPDYSQLVLAYLPPANWDGPAVPESSLFTMPADGSEEPKLLLPASSLDESFLTPSWSANGEFIYYSRMTITDSEEASVLIYDLERVHVESGAVEKVVGDAFWPSLSPDGNMLAFLSVEANSTDNNLYISGATGADLILAVNPDDFKAVDAQLFSPNSRLLYFSGAVESAEDSENKSLWEMLTAVQTASAHSFPADWWRLDLESQEIEQLTDIQEVGLAGAFSPDGRHLAFAASQGLYLMMPDGSELEQILRTVTFGPIAWTP